MGGTVLRSHVWIVALFSLLASGCASGMPCICSLLPGAAAELTTPPAPEPVAEPEPEPLPPVAAPPPPEPSRRIVLRGVNFAFDSAALANPGREILDAAIESLKENPGVKIRIEGHTCNIGTDEYNDGLSERRAERVSEYLRAGGVSADQIVSVRGHGESQPLADNGSRDGRAQNRRVELNILE